LLQQIRQMVAGKIDPASSDALAAAARDKWWMATADASAGVCPVIEP
jgi:hypothetical protein